MTVLQKFIQLIQGSPWTLESLNNGGGCLTQLVVPVTTDY
jgi:hypothetical protein